MEPSRDYYREVAESLLASASNSYSRQLLAGNTSSELLLGADATRIRDGRRISSVRRFFCLFCTFDLLFTALLWLISVMLTGESMEDLWRREVLGYHVGSSLLDVVGVAALRFSLLLLAYAILRFDHWTTVALTTSGTCTFLIAKVFIFDWTKSPQPVFQVLLVLMSFSLCWGEAWLLDCKVLPQEQLYSGGRLLLPPPAGPRLGPSDVTSIGDFYSPTESPEGSPRLPHRSLYDTAKNAEMIRIAANSEKEALELMASPAWKKEKDGPKPGDVVETMQHPKYGKIFKLTGVVDCPADFLAREMSDGLEKMSSWNPTILECKVIMPLDAETSLTYQVTTGGPRNAVKPRDFVSVRRVTQDGTRHLNCAVSVEHASCPPSDKYIRGWNHVGCWSLEAVKEDGRDQTVIRWLMACDLKGWLPQYVLDIAFSTAQLDFLAYIRAYADKSRAEGVF